MVKARRSYKVSVWSSNQENH